MTLLVSHHELSWNLIHNQNYCAQINNNMVTALKNHRLNCQNNVNYYHIAGFVDFFIKKTKCFYFALQQKHLLAAMLSLIQVSHFRLTINHFLRIRIGWRKRTAKQYFRILVLDTLYTSKIIKILSV